MVICQKWGVRLGQDIVDELIKEGYVDLQLLLPGLTVYTLS